MPTIGNAPLGEDSSIDESEKIPVSGSKWLSIATLVEYLRTKAQTLTNKTLTTPTIASFTNATHAHLNAAGGGTLAFPDGMAMNLKLSVTVSSNDLIVALKTYAGTDPSSSDPGYVKIDGTIRSVTAATSITIADGTNWFSSGSAELGTQLVGYFAYLVWDSNSSIVALTIARIPYARLVSDFNSTTTNEKHCFNYANFTTTDSVVNIGYFEATLSLSGTSHLWTVPTFTNTNLRHQPTFETQRLAWVPTLTGYSAAPTNTVYQYVVRGLFVDIYIREGASGTSNATSLQLTAPFTALTLSNAAWSGVGAGFDNGAALTTPVRIDIASASASLLCYPNMSAAATWTNANGKRIAIGSVSYPIG